MFVTLLIANFLIAGLVCFLIALVFRTPIARILQRLVADDLSSAWVRYIIFAIYVVGISGGVRIWDLEKYITPKEGSEALTLTFDRWVLEIYRTIIGTLQSNAWMLLLFFLFALIAYVILRGMEMRRQGHPQEQRQHDASRRRHRNRPRPERPAPQA
jgi:hypothetical protein